MRSYGYLSRGASDSETLYSSEAIADALVSVQKFGNIAQTGQLDEDTVKVCGIAVKLMFTILPTQVHT